MKKNKFFRLLIFLSIGLASFLFYLFIINGFLNRMLSTLKRDPTYNFLNTLEQKSLDLFIGIRSKLSTKYLHERYETRKLPENVSKDIMIIAIDEKSLNEIGRWPFKRSIHGKLTDYFTNSKNRESVLFFDVFFSEPDKENPKEDITLIDSIKNNKNVIFDYVARDKTYDTANEKNEMQKRIDFIKEKFGEVKNVSGRLDQAVTYLGLTPPTINFMKELNGVGCAYIQEDKDKILRRFPLVFKYVEKKEIDINELNNEGQLDKIFLQSYDIAFNKKNNEYSLKKYEPVVFDQTGVEYPKRKVMSERLNQKVIKMAGQIEDNFRAKLEKIKNEIKNNNKISVDKIGENSKSGEDKYEKISLYDYIYNDKTINFNKTIVFKESFFISIPLALLLKYYHVEINDIDVIYGKEITLKNPKAYNPRTNKVEKLIVNNKVQNAIRIPIDKHGNMLINFAGKKSSSSRNMKSTFDVYSYDDFIAGKQILVKNKLAMVGAFTNGIADDSYQTPLGTMFGIEVIANAVNTILMHDYINVLNPKLYLFILLAVSLLIAFFASQKNILLSYIYSVAFIFIYFLIASFLFISGGILLEVPKVIIVALFSLMSIIVYRVLTEERQKNMIKQTFSKYVNPIIVEELMDAPPELGGIDRELTIFFSDIRGFTTLSEGLEPQVLITHLNEYLSAMTDIVLDHGGTLDKYIGDAVMCFWNAPKLQSNHAELGCKAALKQMAKLKELNEKWPDKMKLNIGIGINTGIVTVGNVGSKGRMDYTIIGDNVNLCSRLESLNKTYGTNIIVSEYTYEKVKDKFNFKELDTVKVKGKEKPVKIYELLGER